MPRDRETFAQALASFGAQLLREVTDPVVVGVHRIAIAEAVRAPEVAKALDLIGRKTTRDGLREIMSQARSAGVVDGQPDEMAQRFAGLLWGDLMVRLLLRVANRPAPAEITRRARDATTAFLKLYPEPN